MSTSTGHRKSAAALLLIACLAAACSREKNRSNQMTSLQHRPKKTSTQPSTSLLGIDWFSAAELMALVRNGDVVEKQIIDLSGRVEKTNRTNLHLTEPGFLAAASDGSFMFLANGSNHSCVCDANGVPLDTAVHVSSASWIETPRPCFVGMHFEGGGSFIEGGCLSGDHSLKDVWKADMPIDVGPYMAAYADGSGIGIVTLRPENDLGPYRDDLGVVFPRSEREDPRITSELSDWQSRTAWVLEWWRVHASVPSRLASMKLGPPKHQYVSVLASPSSAFVVEADEKGSCRVVEINRRTHKTREAGTFSTACGTQGPAYARLNPSASKVLTVCETSEKKLLYTVAPLTKNAI